MAVLTGLGSVAVFAAAAPSQAAGIHSGHSGQGAADHHLYVTNMRSDDISVFSLSHTGRPTPDGPPVASGALTRGIVFTPDGSTAYVVNTGVNAVTAYAVNEHGALSPLATAATGGEEPFGLALAPNGRSLYVTNIDSGTVSAFRVNDDGTLVLLGAPVPSGASDPRGGVVTPNGRFLYVGHGRPNATPSDVVTAFAIRDDGSLRRAGAPVRTGGAGTGMVTSPDGRFL
jgi:6-phosphogluconolactonase (cycloisomerase 2 family)